VLAHRAQQDDETDRDDADALHAGQRRDGKRMISLDRQLALHAPMATVLAVSLLKT
jgi:hypothetical protein